MLSLDDHIKAEAAVHGLPWPLVKAICLVESSLNPYARRYEPLYRWLYGDAALLSPTERIGQMQSWGIMQVMGAVAREHGFAAPREFTELCTLPLGLTYGCLHLARFRAKYTLWADVVASYNAGSPRKDAMGAYEPRVQQYVEKVFRAWTTFDSTHPIRVQAG